MRILIAGVNYAPELTGIGPHTTGLAEHLASAGHEVVVATSFPSFPAWSWYEPPAHWRTRERVNGVDVRRTMIVLPRRRTAFWRIVFDSSIALTSALTALSIPRVDLTVAVSPPVQTALLVASMRSRIGKLVMLVKDLPIEAARSVGMMSDGPALRIGHAVERMAYSRADHIVVISGAFAKYLQKLGIDASRISEIPDGVDIRSIRPREADLEMRQVLGASPGDFLVVHSGNMGAKQDLTNVVAAARSLRADGRIKLALIGDGMRRTEIENDIAKNSLKNIRVLPIQPSAEFPRVLAAADALLVNQGPMVVDSVLPSKLLTYMAAGRPVIAAAHPDSTTVAVVNNARCGVVVAPGQPDALAEALRSMADHARRDQALKMMGDRGRAYVEAHYERGMILHKWDDLLATLTT